MRRIELGSAVSLVVICGLVGVASCGRQPGQSQPADLPAQQAPVPITVKAPDRTAETSPQSAAQTCYFAVDGQVRVQGPCLVFPFGDGGYTLNAWSDGKPKQSHFAVVTTNGDGAATATWNADPDDNRAGDPLGVVTFAEGCWTNARTRICAGR